MKVIKFAPGLIPVLKHGEHDQSSHGNWATGTDVWSATKGDLDTTFTTKDGSLKVKVANAFMDNPEYKETIKKTLDTVENLQNDFPIKGEIYFQEGDFVTGTDKAWATTMSVSEGGRRSSQITLTEGLLKSTAKKDFLEYTITHEWGHAIDRRDSDRVIQSIEFLARNSDTLPMTKYGYRNGREAFAEAFAVKRLRSHEGGIRSEDVPQDPKWERTFNILEVPSVVSKATNQSGVSFFVADTFDPDNPPVLIENYTPPVQKHLQGQHDQSTHGRWAESGLPHELEDVKGSLQKYFDNGMITKKNEVTRAKREYKAKEDGSGYETVTIRVPVGDSLDRPFMTYRAPYEYEDAEGAQIFKEYEAKMLGGNFDEIKDTAQQEALDSGMGSRQALYYGQAIASRASLYVTLQNEALRQQAAEKVYSRDFGDYQEKGGSREFFEQRAKTMKTLSENISKAEPVIAIETDSFLGVVKDGRFKTQYETRESNGAYKPALRKEAELALSGVPLDTKSSERPVYGYLAVQNDGKTANTSPYNTDKWNVNNAGVGQYGEVRVVLKDSVKERTSYTIPDSLDRNAIPQPLSRNSKADLINAGAYYDLSSSHGGFQRESYVEAQVYGGVKLSDIKAVYVVPSSDYSWENNTYTPKDHVGQAASISSALKAKGFDIPVEILPLPKKED